MPWNQEVCAEPSLLALSWSPSGWASGICQVAMQLSTKSLESIQIAQPRLSHIPGRKRLASSGRGLGQLPLLTEHPGSGGPSSTAAALCAGFRGWHPDWPAVSAHAAFLTHLRGQCDQYPMFRDLRDQNCPPQPLWHPAVVPLPVTPGHSPGRHHWGPHSALGTLGMTLQGQPELDSGPDLPCFCLLQPDVHPGNCWAFQGPQGFAVVRLSARIRPTAVTLEHVPKALSPNSTISSAPKDFSIFVSIHPVWGGKGRRKVLLVCWDQVGVTQVRRRGAD